MAAYRGIFTVRNHSEVRLSMRCVLMPIADSSANVYVVEVKYRENDNRPCVVLRLTCHKRDFCVRWCYLSNMSSISNEITTIINKRIN